MLLVGGVVACAPDPEPDVGPISKSSVGEGDVYVALGDSYTSAPGTGPTAGIPECQQTSVNYPHLIAEATGVTLIDNSCGGATTDSLSEPQSIGARAHAPQLDAVTTETTLVTISLGANNYALFAGIARCAVPGAPQLGGTPCADADAIAALSVPVALEAVENDLLRAAYEIKTRAPDALIIVVGYPQVVPAVGTCLLLPIAAGDYPFARRILAGLNQALETAAAAIDAAFIDVAAASDGHDICSADPWMAGVEAPLGGATPWHPYPAEQRAVAELVLAELTN